MPQEYVAEDAKSLPYYEPMDRGHEAKFRKRMEDLKKGVEGAE